MLMCNFFSVIKQVWTHSPRVKEDKLGELSSASHKITEQMYYLLIILFLPAESYLDETLTWWFEYIIPNSTQYFSQHFVSHCWYHTWCHTVSFYINFHINYFFLVCVCVWYSNSWHDRRLSGFQNLSVFLSNYI